jgi:hypothetical protein
VLTRALTHICTALAYGGAVEAAVGATAIMKNITIERATAGFDGGKFNKLKFHSP